MYSINLTFTDPVPNIEWRVLIVFTESVQEMMNVKCSINVDPLLDDTQYRPYMEVVCERVNVNEVLHTPTLLGE